MLFLDWEKSYHNFPKNNHVFTLIKNMFKQFPDHQIRILLQILLKLLFKSKLWYLID